MEIIIGIAIILIAAILYDSVSFEKVEKIPHFSGTYKKGTMVITNNMELKESTKDHMTKKKRVFSKELLLFGIAILFFSCESEPRATCNCTGKFTNAYNSPSVYYVKNVEIYCDNQQLTKPVNNDVFIGCK